MNRKQRRAMERQDAGVSSVRAAVGQLLGEAARYQHLGKLNEAARLYKRVLELTPDHAEANNNLGCVLLAQGKLKEARTRFERALVLMPQLLDDFTSICPLLIALNPALGEGMQRAVAIWPQRLPLRDLLGSSGAATIASDTLLVRVLQSTVVRNLDIERFLTAVRLGLLQIAAQGPAPRTDDAVLEACCVLAQQCFINEYVFAVMPEEAEQAELLRGRLVDALSAGSRVSPLWVASIAMYFPLYLLPEAPLLAFGWKGRVAELILQQVREPAEERKYRDLIPQLTTIEDSVSVRVRGQYEEHPYPRWVYAASWSTPMTLDEHLRIQFPTSGFQPAGKEEIDILIAGCGTGRHPIEVARQYRGARILAIDLSISSLCYAKRKTPPTLSEHIEYAQADILKLGSLDRRFDLIEISGVLHHLADLFAGWRGLLSLLRPGGFMHVGLYSELARRDIVAARDFIAERGYRSTAGDIRRCRQELLETSLKSVARAGDFFSTSQCRDLLFHVQEARTTIPEIKSFLGDNDLRFIGFEFEPKVLQHYRSIFGSDSAMRDLDRWHSLEVERPDTFSGMYQFWLQKN